MKKIILALVLLLCGASAVHGQVADSTLVRRQGEPVLVTGKGIVLSGALTAAAGGGVMLWAYDYNKKRQIPEDQFNENWVLPMIYALGVSGVIVGTVIVVAGIPVIIAGNTIMKCDAPWRDARYDSKGPGIILEGEFGLPYVLETRATAGYHFNSNIFLGAGVAPGVWLDSDYSTDSRFTMPAYADFRWSFCNRIVSPYLGLSAGMETTDITPYIAAELGTRIRTDRNSTHSFWSSISLEVSGGYNRLGVKMGYSF